MLVLIYRLKRNGSFPPTESLISAVHSTSIHRFIKTFCFVFLRSFKRLIDC